MDNDIRSLLSKPPVFSGELVERCKQSSDYRPMLFEWYKYVGVLCSRVACLSQDSSALLELPPVHYAVLIGLLNRCSRLMLANVRLSCNGRYGETTRLLDRSIAETAIKVQWLSHQDNPDSFLRYLADGLKKDLELKRQIDENISNRKGDILVIEKRMLDSIQNCIHLSGLSEQEVNGAKRLPDFATMCRDLNLGDLFYTATQKMGSHAVHGTWSDRVFNYLRYEDDHGFYPRDHEIGTQDIQYIVTSRLVLAAIVSFLDYVVADPSDIKEFKSELEAIEEEIIEMRELAWTSSFERG